MAEYIEREAVLSKFLEYGIGWGAAKVKGVINSIHAADVVPESDFRDCRNELCLRCGQYKTAHLGSCDGCRWRH